MLQYNKFHFEAKRYGSEETGCIRLGTRGKIYVNSAKTYPKKFLLSQS